MNEALWARLQRSESALDGVTSDAEDAVLQLQAALQQAAQRQAAQRQAQGQHEHEVGGWWERDGCLLKGCFLREMSSEAQLLRQVTRGAPAAARI